MMFSLQLNSGHTSRKYPVILSRNTAGIPDVIWKVAARLKSLCGKISIFYHYISYLYIISRHVVVPQ